MEKIKFVNNWASVDGYALNLDNLNLVDISPNTLDRKFVNSDFLQSALINQKNIQYSKSKAEQILALEITEDCNYGCKYCFEGNNCQVSKTSLDFNLACKAIDKLPNKSQLRFFGGEPLLQFNLIKKIVKRYPNHTYSIVTNGSLLTKEIARFLSENNFSVGLSYDGYGWQEKNRVSLRNNSQKDFERAVNLLSKANAYIGVSTVLTKESIPYLYDIHLEVFSNFPINGWAYLIGYSENMTLSDLDVFQNELFSIVNDFPSEHLLKINDLKKWAMKITGEWPIDGFCGAGTCYSAITSKGESRFCPFFLRESSCYGPKIGLEEVICSKCPIWNFCKGGCLALNMYGSGDTHKSHPFSCKKNHIYFEAGLKTRIKMRKEIEV